MLLRVCCLCFLYILTESRLLTTCYRFLCSVLYYHWSGPHWNLHAGHGWLRDSNNVTDTSDAISNECDWVGVACNSQNVVTKLNMSVSEVFVSTFGRIPSELALLSSLQTLVLTEHNLQGSLPSNILYMTDLQQIDLRSNHLTSFHPTMFSHLHKLQVLRLGHNRLNQRLPTDLFSSLTQLRQLDLEDNRKLQSDNFWESIAQLPRLESLTVSYTALGGTWTDAIGSLTHLTTLEASATPFRGTLSTKLGQLTRLKHLSLMISSERGLSGTLPTELAKMTALEFLALDHNPLLEATLMTEFGNMRQLATLSV